MDWWNIIRTILVLLTGVWSGWLQYKAKRDAVQRDIEVARTGASAKDVRITQLEAQLQERDQLIQDLRSSMAVLEHDLKVTHAAVGHAAVQAKE